MKKNKSQLPLIVMGCISAVLNGASLPFFGIIFGGIIGVRSTLSYGELSI